MNKPANIVLIIVIVLAAVFGISSYNTLKSTQIETQTQYSQIENQIQRCADLIPNLVSTVKGYMQYEEKVLNEITEARTKVISAGSIEDKVAADSALSGALSRLIAISENYHSRRKSM